MDEERRIELENCIFCPLRETEICIPYQAVLVDYSKKPSFCLYKALIVGGDHRNDER